jgi:hypothetical protein
MKSLVWCSVAVLVLASGAAASSACVNTVMTVTPGLSFSCGNLIFSNFSLSGVSQANPPVLEISSLSISNQGVISFDENPGLASGGQEDISFTVTGSLNSLSLAVGGLGAVVTERACANPIATSGSMAGLCPDSSQTGLGQPIGETTVASVAGNYQLAPGMFSTGPVYIFESIEAGSTGLSAIDMNFGDPVPEPLTFVLLGSALAFVGLLGRRRFRKTHPTD